MVIGSARRNIPLLEARTEDGKVVTATDGMIGAGTAPFYLVFPEDWFADGEFIVGNLNEIYQFRILGDAKIEGTNAVYRVELAAGNTAGVPKGSGYYKPLLINLKVLKKDNKGQAF